MYIIIPTILISATMAIAIVVIPAFGSICFAVVPSVGFLLVVVPDVVGVSVLPVFPTFTFLPSNGQTLYPYTVLLSASCPFKYKIYNSLYAN